MKKILCYIYNEMADFEVSLLLHRLKNTGKRQIVSVSDTLEFKTAQSGLVYKPDMLIKDIDCPDHFEALIIPGGPINNEQNEILPLLANMVGRGKLVAAICFGPQFLGRAGILDQYKYTTSCSGEKIKQLNCKDPFNRDNYIISRTVVDRNVITAQGYAFIDFAVEVCRYLDIFQSEIQEYEQLGKMKDK